METLRIINNFINNFLHIKKLFKEKKGNLKWNVGYD